MKNLFLNISRFFLIALIVMACEEESEFTTDNILQNENYVYFAADNPGSINEASARVNTADGHGTNVSQKVDLTLLRTGSSFDTDLTVTVNTTAVYSSTTDFQNAGDDASETIVLGFEDQVVIPAGQPSADFTFTVLDNVLSDGNKTVTFTIASVSDQSYSIGFPGAETTNVSQTVTVEDDDCPIDIPNVWSGIWIVKEFPAAPGSFNEGFAVTPAVGRAIELSLDESNPAGTSALITTTDNPDYTSLLADGVVMPMSFNTCPGTVLIGPDTYTLSFNQNSAPAVMFRADEPGTFGNGNFSEDGSTFTITCSYGNNTGSNFDEFNAVFVRPE